MIDITRKDLSKQYPVYTKAGNIWKNRIDWNSILKPGTVISTHFGIFTFVNTYKENKVWYIILSDGVNNYTVKRQQARNNKKLPKTTKVQQVITLYNAEMIDTLYESAKKLDNNFNSNGHEIIEDYTELKIQYTVGIYKKYRPHLLPKLRSQILKCYHPDRGNNLTYNVNSLKKCWGTALYI